MFDFSISPTLAINETVKKLRLGGKNIYHLGFGESPFPVPKLLQESLRNSTSYKAYLPTEGLKELREAALTYYSSLLSLEPNDFEVMIAPGSKLFLFATQLAIEGDLLLPVPSWVSYAPHAKYIKAEVIPIPTKLDDDGYHINAEQLLNSIKVSRENNLNPTKLILNYPNNPTGLKIPNDELEQIAHVCQQENITIISDEIYGLVNFNFKQNSIAQYAPEKTIISTSLSKHLSLGGWRLGVALIPKANKGLFNTINQVASELWTCTPAPIQYATTIAFSREKEIEQHIQDCSNIHKLILEWFAHELRTINIDVPFPQGAFYLYPNFDKYKTKLLKLGIKTSSDLSHFLLNEYSVATLPGVVFGEKEERLSIRLALCDYDGEKALNAFKDNRSLSPKEFVRDYTPRITDACTALKSFMRTLESTA